LTRAKSKFDADTAGQRETRDRISQLFKRDLAVRVGVQEATGLHVGRDHAAILCRALNGKAGEIQNFLAFD
jgi:hypothetical protein